MFGTGLAFHAIVFGVEIAAFTVLRPWFKAIYEPRTYVPSSSRRKGPKGPLSEPTFLWPIAVFKADYRDIISTNGLDAYFFVRFLRMITRMLLPIWFFSWVILIPINSVNTRVGDGDGLHRYTFGNIEPTKQSRYLAHLILVYLSTAWILYNIQREMKSFVLKRQEFLVNPQHANTMQAKALLVTGIPAKELSKEALRKIFACIPGGVKEIWINRDLKDLPDIYRRLLSACDKLESAETSLLKTAVKLRLADNKKAEKGGKAADIEAAQPPDTVSVPRDQRPQHRLGKIPFVGKKVDTIDWCRSEIQICLALLIEGRSIIEKLGVRGRSSDDPIDEGTGQNDQDGYKFYPPIDSAFIVFQDQIAAHLAKQSLTYHEPYHMSEKYLEVNPDDVIWSHLSMNPYDRKIVVAYSWAVTAIIIIFWALPVALVGVIFNVNGLCTSTSWLAWLCELPEFVTEIIANTLPAVLLENLMELSSIILRTVITRLDCIPKRSAVELSLMNRYFIFLVVHSFFGTTFSFGANTFHDLVMNPMSAPFLLAENLPRASTFFFTYIVFQGLPAVSKGFLRIGPLISYHVKFLFFRSTPRSVYRIKFGLSSLKWGTTFPSVTILVVITLGYSIISPIINGLACTMFFGLYMVYKYLLLWVYDQPLTSDTGGLFFPKAIQHVFVGLYIQQVCLAALFFHARNENRNLSAIAEGHLMVVLIVLTAGFHAFINKSYGHLVESLPLSILNQSAAGPAPSTDNNQVSVVENPVLEENEGGTSCQPPKPWAAGDRSFVHPALSRPQRTIWLPKDTLGLVEEEKRACEAANIIASYEHAHMDEKGKVDINGPPPDECDEG